MTQERIDELTEIFKGIDPDIFVIVKPLIVDLANIEEEVARLRDEPMIRYHPKDRSIQKPTPSARLYRDLLAKESDIVRLLCSQVRKGPEETVESPLRAYYKSLKD